MTQFRFLPLAFALTAATALVACNTPPPMPMGTASAGSMTMAPGDMAKMEKMEAQMKTMQAMHEKMMNAKSPAWRTALMAEHMTAMQGGMAMMDEMGGADMGDMPAMAGDMHSHHKMMAMRMKMMQSMMAMMMDRMPHAPDK
jgi:hypothetical protein